MKDLEEINEKHFILSIYTYCFDISGLPFEININFIRCVICAIKTLIGEVFIRIINRYLYLSENDCKYLCYNIYVENFYSGN